MHSARRVVFDLKSVEVRVGDLFFNSRRPSSRQGIRWPGRTLGKLNANEETALLTTSLYTPAPGPASLRPGTLARAQRGGRERPHFGPNAIYRAKTADKRFSGGSPRP